MLNGDLNPKGGEVSAPARFTARPTADGEEFESRPRSVFSDERKAFTDRDAQACKVDFLSWDLGAIWLERSLFFYATGKGQHRGGSLSRRDCIVYWQHSQFDALTHSRKGSSPDFNVRVVVKTSNERGDGQILTAYLPGTFLQESVPSPSQEPVVALNSWQGAVLSDFLLSLAEGLPCISKEHWPGLGAATGSLVEACLARTSIMSGKSHPPRSTVLRERIGRVVRQQMGSADFTPKTLVQLVTMSRSKLYRIFEGTGGVARFIQQERLDEARRRLADIGDTTPINMLACEIGFRDHSSFSRAFKLRYGSSPSKFRETASVSRPLEVRGHPSDIGRSIKAAQLS